ncbi:3-oxoacyl-(acyl-carrier-protein) synthase II [Candidatus Termititenax persephonae]|uniref:3-oxoacyl-[acyl-carrier-protein] synthase 2 n=1 Tax=Candidatus Termititenax persephonae TaxID=2218525 RepID=A0A388THR9_9BACT|nr:3-oxoacyl-(acyl-carrier-protein) synthase II [Candidatus Termititenax persephonae]
MTKRVVITGVGTVNALGNSTAEAWPRLLAGETGIVKVTDFDVSPFKAQIAATVKDFDIGRWNVEKKEAKRMARFMQFALAASLEAVQDSGFDIKSDPENVGVIVSSGIGGLEKIEEEETKLLREGPARLSPFLVPMMIADSATGMVSIQTGAKGVNFSVVSACASGTHSIGEAFTWLKCGKARAIIAGGAESCITPLGLGGFCAARTLCADHNDNPQEACRPFDAHRSGFVMGEGAGVLFLEEMESALQRGAKIYAEMVGYGATGDAYHITSPAPNGEGGARAIRMALQEAGLAPAEIDYINAHGTSTALNDKCESQAIASVFGGDTTVNISSTKGALGHCLGAAGGIEAVVLAKTVETELIPPTLNYQTPDPNFPQLNFTPNQSVRRTIRAALSTSFGFGGHNAIIVFKKFKQ